MEHCKYHPRNPSRWYCQHCDLHFCNDCVEKDINRNQANCFNCGKSLNRLSSSKFIVPFWRRLPKIHSYPLKGTPLVATLVLSFLFMIVVNLGFLGLILLLPLSLLTAAYCSGVMVHTSEGNLVQPPPTDMLRSEGWMIVAMTFGYFLGWGALLWAGSLLLGVVGAVVVSLFIPIAYPAALISMTVDRHFLSLLNPLRLLSIIAAIGAPYFLMSAFLVLLSVGNGAVSALLGSGNIFVIFLQIAVSIYFTIVMYHMIGYVVFQYQDELGYEVSVDVTDELDGEGTHAVDIAATNAINRANVLIREGRPKDAVTDLIDAASRFPANMQLQDFAFKVVAKAGSRDQKLAFGEQYMNTMLVAGQNKKAALAYMPISQADPDIKPADPDKYHDLANLLKQMGKPQEALRLLNGFNEYFPDHPDEIRNYMLAVEILLAVQPDSPVIDSVLGYLEEGEEDEELLKQVQILRARANRIRQKKTG